MTIRKFILLGIAGTLAAGCAMDLPTPALSPEVAATLSLVELAAVRGNYAYVGESARVVDLTPAFTAQHFQGEQKIESANGETDIDTYESDTYAVTTILAHCTTIYILNDVVTNVSSYDTSYDARYVDHGC